MTFADALFFLFELADREDPRYRRAAARWHARFVLEAKLDLTDASTAMQLLAGIRGANRHIVRRRLVEQVERAGLSAVDVPS